MTRPQYTSHAEEISAARKAVDEARMVATFDTAIRALPTPPPEALLAEALKLPEVAAVVDAGNHARLALAGYVSRQSAIDKLDTALAKIGRVA